MKTQNIIREATGADVERVVEMGRRFLLEGPYKEKLADNPGEATMLARRLLGMPNAKIIVLEIDGKVQGVFAFIIFPHYYSGETIAGEMIWYVEPESRTLGNYGLEILWKAEHVAAKMGAKRMQLTAPTNEVANMYRLLTGYEQVEISFQRDIEGRAR